MMMQNRPTPYADINELLAQLLSGIQRTLGEKLVGLYLYGSLIVGDFDFDISDIDLVAALSSAIDENDFAALQHMHTAFADTHQEWDNRIEVCYISVAALQTVTSRTTNVANISPGEPLNIREAGKHWLIDWYVVREKGVPLFGPPPEALIEPISKEAFLQTVREHAEQWREWIQNMRRRGAQAYAILTLCRALYTLKHGTQVSKKRAALWAEQAFPQWASLIQNALIWRESQRNDNADSEATFPETLQFVYFAIAECERTQHP